MEDGGWEVEVVMWMGGGRWEMEDGRWKIEDGVYIINLFIKGG